MNKHITASAITAMLFGALTAPAFAGTYSVSATPTTGLKSGDSITVTVNGLGGGLGVYASVCQAPANPMDTPTLCDQASTAWIADGSMGSTKSPAAITVQSTFDGKSSPSATTSTSVDCLKVSCALYVRGDHNNRTDYSLIRLVALTFQSGGKVLAADDATATYANVTLKANQAGQLTYRKPIRLNVKTTSGLKVTLTSLTPDCGVSGTTVTALKGTGVCAIAATTAGNATYAPLNVNFPFYLNLAKQTIKATWPRTGTLTVGAEFSIPATNFVASMEQPVTLSSNSAVCKITDTGSGWTVKFTAKGSCRLTATAQALPDKTTSASASMNYSAR